MDRIERLKDLIPKLKANKKIHLLKIESLEWELKFLESEKKQLTLTDVISSNGFKGKYVVSYGRSGLYDLYNSKDELICDGVNYKDLNNILVK